MFAATSSRRRGPSGPEVTKHGKSSKYPWRLNFYNRPPPDDVTLEEFEEYAIARLRIISLIESAQIRGLPPSQLVTSYEQASKKYLPLSANTAKNVDLSAERKKDVISHFVLRLAFCGSEELRKRYLRAETTLFKIRFESDDKEERTNFLKELQLDWKLVSEPEKESLKFDLLTVTKLDESAFRAQSFYKVHWTLVPDLVEKRKVLLKGGLAYVPQSEQLSLVLQAFSARLEAGLELTAKYLPRLDEDQRLLPILNHLSLSYLTGSASTEYTFDPDNNSETVTAEMIDHLAPRHFPPCMRHLWNVTENVHHLKHYARLQLGLFLKGVGLSVEEALVWWRKAFLVPSKMTDDTFRKEYQYNIRHSFGLEGRKMNYAPKSCQRILTQDQPGAQDIHGCPFRHFAPARLSLFLEKDYRISGPDLQEVMNQVKSTHYHVACTRVFELTHRSDVQKGEGLGNGESVDHPNKWFDRSWELEKSALGEVNKVDGDHPVKDEVMAS
ncbi:dna primase large subunit [Phaffia rhodozyma]|uniref:DNA primase large subunit n=1 Tax=Phaffia rhodozyma TaxID=264483 RepID=A0A0F7SQY2_PHARH|nr:dna primase large subunit [Phaffia rhodozyma]